MVQLLLVIPTIDPWLNIRLVYDLYLKSIEGPWLVDRLWEVHVTFFILHNKLLQVSIWLGLWIFSLSWVLTVWQTSVCWSVIYLCEAVAKGVWSFGSTLCTRTLVDLGSITGSLGIASIYSSSYSSYTGTPKSLLKSSLTDLVLSRLQPSENRPAKPSVSISS